jgi:hypothetical protein
MDKHPITPSPELVEEWATVNGTHYEDLATLCRQVAIQAAQWGADQELDACCEWFQEFYKTESWVKHDLKHFRAARRPKPPSLKEEALKGFDTIASIVLDEYSGTTFYEKYKKVTDTVIRALEALPE